jgi:SAM-dependent methyltransferase
MYSARLLTTFAAGEHESFMAAGGRPLRPRLARALALAQLEPGLTVVDIGCGRGETLLHLGRRGCRAFGLDFSPEGLRLARSTVGVGGAAVEAAVTLVASDAERLPLASASVDRVLLLDVVEHLTSGQLGEALGEVRRILRPDGYVVIHTLPNRWALTAYRCAAVFVPALPLDPRSAYERRVHVNEQSPRSLMEELGKAGLAHRVWVEEWTTRHAARGRSRRYPDTPRERAYPVLGHKMARRLGATLLGTPLGPIAGNDLFAVAWREDALAPPELGPRARPVR